MADAIAYHPFAIPKLLADVAAAGDFDTKVTLLLRACDVLPHAPNRPEAVEALARAVGRDAVWFEQMLELPVPEQRRALRSAPLRISRHRGEQAYPQGGWLGDYLLYCQESEAPLGWHFWCGVALLAVIARRNFYWDRGRYFLFLNHYVLLLGQSGLTKSTTIAQVIEVFEEVQALAAAQDATGREPFYRSPERITPERLLVDLSNWTIGMTNTPRRDTILFVASDELATLLGKEVKGSDRLANLLTDIYMGKRKHQDSTIIGRDRKLINVACTCLFATTQASMRRAITEGMFSEGFMARTITAPRGLDDRHGEYATPPPSDPVMRHQLSKALVPWLELDREIELRLSPEATEWFEDWYSRHRQLVPEDEKLIAFWQRKPDHVNRLAGVLWLSQSIAYPDALAEAKARGIVVIEQPTMEYALRLIELEESQMPTAFAQIGARDESRDVYRVEDAIRRYWDRTGEPISHSTLLQNSRHIVKDGQHLAVIVQTLLLAESIEVVRSSERAKTYYRPQRRKRDG